MARELQTKLNASIIGRSRKQRIVLDKYYVIESLKVGERTLEFPAALSWRRV